MTHIIMKIAFTSCSNVTRKGQQAQPIWGIIKGQNPDLLLLLGDNVYLGDDGYGAPLKRKMEKLAARYDAQLAEPHFDELVSNTPFLAIWDNHDFGLPGDKFRPGDATVERYGAEVPQAFRDASREIFNSKLKSLKHSVAPPSSTVYCAHLFEDESGKKIKCFLLDVRSFQDDPSKVYPPNRHHPTLLGEEQENWLLRELESSTAGINVICSGIPYRYWKKYPRWFDAFNKVAAKKSKLLFLGGQVHHNEFNTHLLIDQTPRVPEWPPIPIETTTLYEAISSGVGQNHGEDDGEPGHRNNGDIMDNPGLENLPRNNYGIIDFTKEHVFITLYGQSADDVHYAAINRPDWTLKGYWSMRRAVNL